MLLSKRAISAPTQITITQKQYDMRTSACGTVWDIGRTVAYTGDLFLYLRLPNSLFLPTLFYESHHYYQLTSIGVKKCHISGSFSVLTINQSQYLQPSPGLICKDGILSDLCWGLLDNDEFLAGRRRKTHFISSTNLIGKRTQ